MKALLLGGLFVLSWFSTGLAHAQAACPPGWVPYGTSPDTSSCGPDPSAQQQAPQSAQPSVRWASQWGAIVIDESPNNAGIGVSQGKASREEAVSSAMADCRAKGGTDCKLNLAYGNQCVALIAGIRYARGQPAATVDDASAQGMQKCQAAGISSCTVYYSACSLPRQVH